MKISLVGSAIYGCGIGDIVVSAMGFMGSLCPDRHNWN
jgi:hypothetical protein